MARAGIDPVSMWIRANVSFECWSVAVMSSAIRLARNGGRKSLPIRYG